MWKSQPLNKTTKMWLNEKQKLNNLLDSYCDHHYADEFGKFTFEYIGVKQKNLSSLSQDYVLNISSTVVYNGEQFIQKLEVIWYCPDFDWYEYIDYDERTHYDK